GASATRRRPIDWIILHGHPPITYVCCHILWAMGGGALVGAGRGALARRIAAFDNDGLHFARAVAAESRGTVIFRRGEARDALLEGRKLDHDKPLELGRPFHHLIAATAREHLAAELGNDARHEIGVLLVFDRIVDLGWGTQMGRHVVSSLACALGPPLAVTGQAVPANVES